MAKSRMVGNAAALAVSVASASAAAAQTVDGEALIEAQRDSLRSGLRLECPRGSDGDIVVCGSRGDDRQYRLAVPEERTPRSADRAGGEQRAALEAGTSRCTAVGRDQQCNGGISLIGIGFAVARAVAQAIANQD